MYRLKKGKSLICRLSTVALAKCYCSSFQEQKHMKEEKVCIEKKALYLILWRTYTVYHVIKQQENLSLAYATI